MLAQRRMYSSGLEFSSVLQAYYKIKDTVKKTPLDYSPWLSRESGSSVWLKKEQISITGSYKERGALNKIMSLSESQRECGVVCSSAGNHAQAVSHHATRLGINAKIVMPTSTPYVKVKRTKELGGTVILHGRSFSEALAHAKEIEEAEGRTFVHAFDDPLIVAGQGTVGLELLEQNSNLETIIIPVGGGGLIAGVALALKEISPSIQIVGVESTMMPGMYNSKAAGHVTPVERGRTIADGIAVETVGQTPFEIVQSLVDDIVLVDENEISAAVLHLLEVEKTVVEASGAAGVAALCNGKVDVKGKNVGVILTGGNIDMSILGRIIEKGMVKDGRMCRFRVTIDDTPGGLGRLATFLGDLGANIRDIVHERAFMSSGGSVYFTENIITLDSRGPDHIRTIKETLEKQEFVQQMDLLVGQME